ncbi:MAG TPA: response regulator [Terriglobales bacterium]
MPKETPTVVLCVDDDPRAMMARSLILSVAGYDVQTASSSEAALSIFRRYKVDLVIADHFLPGMKGTELADAMKKIKPDVLFVLLMVTPELPSGAEQVDLVLVKGMDPQQFLGDIQTLLAMPRRKAAAGASQN